MTDPALGEERDFLLKSLDDLDAEYAVGDLEADDYRTLTADYTARAASVIRQIEGERTTQAVGNDKAGRGGWWWMLAVALLATLAGVFVAQFSGSRGSNDTITGEIRVTARELVLEAQAAFGQGDLDGAISIYDEVLVIQPSNVEALTYKAWFTRLQGDADAASPIIEDAVAIDPEYPDARVFATVIALDTGDVVAAQGHLDAFDLLAAPPFLEELVVQQGLRARLGAIAQAEALARVEAQWLSVDGGSFAESGLTASDVLLAAEAVAAGGDVFGAVGVTQAALDEVPDNTDLLAGYAWILARSASVEEPAPADLGLSFLDRALVLDSTHPEALVYRSFTRAFLGDRAGATADLAAFDALPVRPADLRQIITEFGLRAMVAGG
jgi:tetratricopeptide (TPR) repeat protein